jgi:hypothetical protein
VDRLALAYAASPLLFWLLGSELVYGFSTNVLWLIRSRDLGSLYFHLLAQIWRFLFFVGIPYLALGGWPRQPFQGLLSLEDMGLVGPGPLWPVNRWLEAGGTGLGVGLLVLIFLVLAWNGAHRAGDGPRTRLPSRPWWTLLVDVLYLQVHWAFYRAAAGTLLGDDYAGIFVGLGLIYLEWGLNPAWRQGWRSASQAAGQWLHAALALVTAILFLLTRNLWVCLAIHWSVEPIFWRFGRGQAQIGKAPEAS